MPLSDDDRPEGTDSDAPADENQLRRRQAIKQIERRRRFHKELVGSAIGMVLLVAIWAISEYQNAGGWPTGGFSESSGIPNVWNLWIAYPLIVWVLILVGRGWSVYGARPVSEEEIQREIERQARRR